MSISNCTGQSSVSAPDPESHSEESSDNDITDHSHNLSILHINAQSLRNKIDELELESEEAGIIAISETWLEPSIKNEDLQIPSFNDPIRRDRPNQPYRGVAIYFR